MAAPSPKSEPEPLHRRIIPLVARTVDVPTFVVSRKKKGERGRYRSKSFADYNHFVRLVPRSIRWGRRAFFTTVLSLGPTTRIVLLETTSNLKIFAYILITKFLDRRKWWEGRREGKLAKVLAAGRNVTAQGGGKKIVKVYSLTRSEYSKRRYSWSFNFVAWFNRIRTSLEEFLPFFNRKVFTLRMLDTCTIGNLIHFPR